MRPENAFLLSALRRDTEAAGAQRAAARAVGDWPAVAALAREHGVGWWVARAMPGMPAAFEAGVASGGGGAAAGAAVAAVATVAAVGAELAAGVRAAAIAGLAAARQLAELHRVLDAAGVRAVAYKGPALAADVHGDLAARQFSDLDLLIGDADRALACDALRAAGYGSPHGYTAREERLYSRWEGVAHFARGADWPIELHWRCLAPRYGGPQDPAAVVSRAVPSALGGGFVLVPAPEDLAVLLALHGVKHAWGRLLWLADFAAAASRPGFDWSRATERARAWNVIGAWRFAVRVAGTLVALPIPATLMAEAQADGRLTPLVDAVCARLGRSAAVPDLGTLATPRYHLRWIDGFAARARYVALGAFLPTPQERKLAHLPDALLPLAYPVRAGRLASQALGHALRRARGRRP